MIFQSMLTLQKRFCLIDSPIPFQLVCNPMGIYDLRDENNQFIGDRTDIDGTDICSRPAGAWLFDIWKLLPEKYMKENPAFKMAICYDTTLLGEGQEVRISYSDVNLGEGVAGVNGQNVQDIKTHELLTNVNDNLNSLSDEIFSDILYHSDLKYDDFNTWTFNSAFKPYLLRFFGVRVDSGVYKKRFYAFEGLIRYKTSDGNFHDTSGKYLIFVDSIAIDGESSGDYTILVRFVPLNGGASVTLKFWLYDYGDEDLTIGTEYHDSGDSYLYKFSGLLRYFDYS